MWKIYNCWLQVWMGHLDVWRGMNLHDKTRMREKWRIRKTEGRRKKKKENADIERGKNRKKEGKGASKSQLRWNFKRGRELEVYFSQSVWLSEIVMETGELSHGTKFLCSLHFIHFTFYIYVSCFNTPNGIQIVCTVPTCAVGSHHKKANSLFYSLFIIHV